MTDKNTSGVSREEMLGRANREIGRLTRILESRKVPLWSETAIQMWRDDMAFYQSIHALILAPPGELENQLMWMTRNRDHLLCELEKAQSAPAVIMNEEQFGKILFFDCISKPSSAPERNCEQCDHSVECDESCEKIAALILAPPIRVTTEWVENLIATNMPRYVSRAETMLREKGAEVEDKK